MGTKVTKIDQLDEYRHKINEIGKLQAERFTKPLLFTDWTYKWLGNLRILTFSLRILT